ncbi:MAG: MucR family transcriptional regulator [Geodermatophilaceae bacterium]
MLRPIGQLPPQIYWRRRLLLIGIVLVVSFAAGWVFIGGASGDPEGAQTAASTQSTARPPLDEQALPGLEQVLPSLVPPTSAASDTPDAGSTPVPAPAPAPAPAPVEPGPCPDEAIGLTVGSEFPDYAAGSKPLLGLNVANIGAVPCLRDLDLALQVWGLFAADGTRLWGSSDCYPEPSVPNVVLLQPGQVVTFTIIWSGLTSEPTCSVDREALGPGSYILRGYLGAVLSPDVPLVLT